LAQAANVANAAVWDGLIIQMHYKLQYKLAFIIQMTYG